MVATPKRPTVILLVRHAVTPTTGRVMPGRASGLHLSAEGQRQAEATAERIGTLPRVAALYSSPLERARETAEAIARARHMAVRIERGLLELNIGRWTGLTLKQVSRRPEWDVVQRHPSGFRFPDGESFVEMQTRLTETVAALVARHPGEVVVAVSHADPIKAVVAYALGTHLDLFQRIVISPASVSAIAYHRHGPAVLAVNSTGGALDGLGPS
ncbi:MAG TPA: MSMEG_4193 family putative phosphomutase [Candidatus Binatia bacterium]|nr:MSMEG_4193 family putative phosphomutase [Candidatus Binatia bacterium]